MLLCYSLVEVVEEHVVVELLVESRSDDYLVEIPVVDVVLFVVVGILLLDVVGEKVVVDPIPNLLRWDDVVEAIVDGDVVVAVPVVVVLVSFLSSVAVVLVVVVVLLRLVDADEKFSLVDVDFVVDFVDLGAMQVHFYVVTLVLDVVVLFDAVFPMVLLWLWSRLAMSRSLFHSSCSMLSILCQMISSMRCKYLWMIDLLLFVLLLLFLTVKSHCFALFLLSSMLRSIFGCWIHRLR